MTTPRGHFAVAKFTPDGSLDETFGSSGRMVTSPPGDANFVGAALALLPDERICVCGSRRSSGETGFAISCFLASGALDDTFGDDGLALTSIPGAPHAEAQAVAVDSSGRIVAAGWARFDSAEQLAIARYLANGTLDESFASGGILTATIDQADKAMITAVLIDGNDRIVVAGEAHFLDSTDSHWGTNFLLGRYLTDGKVDASFGDNGVFAIPFQSPASARASDLAVDVNGDIVVAGDAIAFQRFAVCRSSADGDIDQTFGSPNAFPGEGKVSIQFVDNNWASHEA